MIILPPIDPNSRIDFYAGSDNAFQRMKSIYNLLDKSKQGTFYASPSVIEDGIKLERIKRDKVDGINPLVICSYRDLHSIFYIADDRPFIMLEDNYSADTRGLLKTVSLFLCGDARSFDFRRYQTKRDVKLFDNDKEAVSKLLDYVKGKEVETITRIGNKSVGIIYMAWGEKAINAIRKSFASLNRLGYQYPIVVFGDFHNTSTVDGFRCIDIAETTINPFDNTKQHKFQFRAGRVKPLLAELSPFDLNLYIDADTQFMKPIHEGFEMLADYDICLTEEKLSLKDLYNKKLSGWELNLLERDTTVIELGGDDSQKFINSGVIFFKRNKKVLKLFSDWHNEWMRFQEWDEQLSLMRAIHANQNLKVKYLPVEWNYPQPADDIYIYHQYGKGTVRV